MAKKSIFILLTSALLITLIIIINENPKSDLQKQMDISNKVNTVMEEVFEHNDIIVKKVIPSENELIEEMNNQDNIAFDIIDLENNKFLLILTNNNQDFVLLDSQNRILHGLIDNGLFPNWSNW